MHILKTIVSIALTPLFFLANWAGVTPTQPTPQPQEQAGAFNVTGGTTYRLKSSISSSEATLNLSSFKEPVSNTLYTMTYLNTTIVYGTVEPQTDRSEFVSFTGITQNSDGSATLTGVTRGLSRSPGMSGCVASTTLAQRHPAQSQFILSDSPCLFAQIPFKLNNETITGAWNINGVMTFASTSMPTLDSYLAPTTTLQFATKKYVDDTAFSGAGVVDGTTVTRGVVELATQIETASSTDTGDNGNLVIDNSTATSTYNSATAALRVPVTQNDGRLDSNFLDLTDYGRQASTTMLTNSSNAWFNGSTTLSSTVSVTDPTLVKNSTGQSMLWYLLASSTNGSVQKMNVSFPARALLRIMVSAPGNSGNDIQFNGDSAINYSYYGATTTLAIGNGATSIKLWHTSGVIFSTIDIVNNLDTYKFVKIESMGSGFPYAATTTPISYPIYGVWATSTAQQITSLQLGGGGTMPANTQVYVYGSAF